MIYKKEMVYNELLRRISAGEYLAQSYLDEQAIAAELSTSRTPIREAFMELAKEGYIEIIPKRGIIVLPFSYQDAADIFEARSLIEPWLIMTYGPEIPREDLEAEYSLIRQEIAAYPDRRDRPGASIFHHPHSLFAKHCTNQLILSILRNMEKQCRRTPNERPILKAYRDEPNRQDLIRSHEVFVDLMLEGRFEDAATEMKHHIAIGRDEYMEYWFGI